VTVDHGLQPGSAEQAERVRAWAAKIGLDPVEVRRVEVGTGGGPEAAARTARYAALDAAADEHRAAAVLLGHTLDDQAETVLLALARGSGARSLSGMAPVRGRYRRPLLGLSRAVTVDACAAAGLDPWADPHNADDGFTRVRVRGVLRALEAAAPGATAGLARSAELLRADADCLDATAEAAAAAATNADGTLDCAALAVLVPAVRTRVLRAAALAAGVPPGALASTHIHALDALVTAGTGQGPVSLPRGVQGSRDAGRLAFGAGIG
ncbi:MAG: tRNA lysidine(34) synthetase TilS, partial [Planctomycetia bacterium]|nr:tRNA lysidine(34) synthetase TilS [Planctomycetia bacterium]